MAAYVDLTCTETDEFYVNVDIGPDGLYVSVEDDRAGDWPPSTKIPLAGVLGHVASIAPIMAEGGTTGPVLLAESESVHATVRVTIAEDGVLVAVARREQDGEAFDLVCPIPDLLRALAGVLAGDLDADTPQDLMVCTMRRASAEAKRSGRALDGD